MSTEPKLPDKVTVPLTSMQQWNPGNSFSHTRMKTLQECERKAALANGLKLSTEENMYLRTGKQFAAYVEEKDDAKIIKAYLDLIEATTDEKERDALGKECAMVLIMAKAYLDHWGEDTYREIYVERPVPGTEQIARGYMDFVNEEGEILGEDKFRGRVTAETVAALKTDPQVTNYFWLAQECGLPASEMDYRITIRPYISKKLSLKEFEGQLKAQVSKNPGKFFFSWIITRSREEIAQHVQYVRKQAELWEAACAEGTFEQNFHACWAGSFICDFHSICSSDGWVSKEKYRVKTNDRPENPVIGLPGK